MTRLPFKARVTKNSRRAVIVWRNAATPIEQRCRGPPWINGLTTATRVTAVRLLVPAWARAKITTRPRPPSTPAKISQLVTNILNAFVHPQFEWKYSWTRAEPYLVLLQAAVKPPCAQSRLPSNASRYYARRRSIPIVNELRES